MAKGIQSILLGFRLLQALTDAEAPMSLKTLAAASEMSPSKARMYLISFMETGLIVQSDATGLYSLGPYAIRLGTRALQRMELMDVASEATRSLQQQSNGLVVLCAWDVRGVIIVSRSEGSEQQPLQFHIGGTASLTSTATGHIFLAFGQREQTWLHAEKEVAQLGLSKTEQRKRLKALEALAERVRSRRVAELDPVVFASGVALSGFAAIAAPIFDEAQRLRYAITLIHRTDRNNKRKDELARLTLETADRASHLAGAQTRAG